jgi:hypothetical protein
MVQGFIARVYGINGKSLMGCYENFLNFIDEIPMKPVPEIALIMKIVYGAINFLFSEKNWIVKMH